MRIFIDTNIILEFIDHRSEYNSVRSILADIRNGNSVGVVSQGCVYTLAFLIERSLKARGIHKPEQTVQLRRLLRSVLSLVEPIGITRQDMLNAIENEDFDDIEDSFQYQSALKHHCDVLVTINIDDFQHADCQALEILTPSEFIAKYLH